jgi:uncharacterized protein (TIGR03437 family)
MKPLKLLPALLFASGLMAQTVETIPFRAVALSSNETPPISDGASGSATIFLHVVRDGTGAIVSGSVDFNVKYKFAGAVSVTAFHIHKAPAGVAGNVVINPQQPRFDDPTGVGALSKQAQINPANPDYAVALDALNGILADPSQFYFNLHTTDHPGGAIRGQLQRAQMRVLMGLMVPTNETPPITTESFSAVGSVVAIRSFDASGAVTSGQVLFDVNYSGFPGDTTFTGLHIHTGQAGVAAGVTISSGMPRTPAAASGTGNLHFEPEVDFTSQASINALNGLFDNPGNYYINVHTTVYPGGASRNQLRATDKTNFQVLAIPDNETPPIVGLAANAPVSITVYTIRNADGTVAAGTVSFDINARFPSGTKFAATHIHDGAAGVAGGVTIDARFAAFPDLTADGFGNIYRIVTASSPAAVKTLNSLLTTPQNQYYNLHTAVNPGGAVRSQVSPGMAGPAAVSFAQSAILDPTRTTVAPGGLAALFGDNLSLATSSLDGFQGVTALPTSVDGTSMKVASVSAPMLLVSPHEINFQVPFEVAAGSQPVVVTSSGGASAPFNLTVAAVAPAIFYYPPNNGIVVKNNDFSLVQPGNAAGAGDVLVIFSTGLGQTSPNLQTGQLAAFPPLYMSTPVTVTIGSQNATVIYSLASPGFAGLYQTAVRMPSGVPAGTATVVLTAGTNVASNSVTIATK